MEPNIAEVAERIKAMREMCDISVEEMAEVVGKTPEEYVQYESGDLDFSTSISRSPSFTNAPRSSAST